MTKNELSFQKQLRIGSMHIYEMLKVGTLVTVTSLLFFDSSVQAMDCLKTHQRIAVGGTAGFESLKNKSNLGTLDDYCKLDLYIHDSAWSALPNNEDRLQIIASFRPDNVPQVELGASHSAGSYFKTHFDPLYTSLKIAPQFAHVNGVLNLTDDEWATYVQEARKRNISYIAPVFTPNSGQWKDNPDFESEFWRRVRQLAMTGGAITIDSPSPVFIDGAAGYKRFIEEEIRWAKRVGLITTFIISPGSSGTKFLADTKELIATLERDDAMPANFVVENYVAVPAKPNFENAVGQASDKNSTLGVATWLADHLRTR